MNLAKNWLLFLALFLIGRRIYVSIPNPAIVSPAVRVVEAREELAPGVTESQEVKVWYLKSNYSEEDLRKAIYQVFGTQARLALAVAKAENNPSVKNWWERVNCWGDSFDKGEYSVGPFQINLAKQCGKGAKVHWNKVPGETLEEKAEWLKNPYNNAVIARRIEVESKGFYPWTGYTSGNYLKYY
jgi:hypothetical protein